MHPEQFERLFLRRGARTAAEEAAGLARARRVATWIVGAGALCAVATLLAFFFWVLPTLASLVRR